MCHFSLLWLLSNFSFIFCFQSLNLMCLGMIFYEFKLNIGICWASWICKHMSFTISRKFLVIIDLISFSVPIVSSFLIGTPGRQMLDIFPIIPEAIFFFSLFLGNLDKLDNLYWFIYKYTNSSIISIMLLSLSSELFNSDIMFFSSKIFICFFLKFSIFLLWASVFPCISLVFTFTLWGMVIIVA